tara:strand:- start:636 stop:1082 length:447 start_codon:yes stop_codon:yes gene_type:complete
MKLVITSGYYDPVHVGHLQCFEEAKKLGDKLVVIVNNDHQAHLKKNMRFMCHDDRMKIVSAFSCVDEVFLSIDTDKSVCLSLEYIFDRHSAGYDEVIFAKGGDRFSAEIPEAEVCNRRGIRMVDGLGAKIRSSSDLTSAWKQLQKATT